MIRNWARPGCCQCPACIGKRAGAPINPAWFATVIVRGFTEAEYATLSAITDCGMLGIRGDEC